jgi:hypothetical protein
MIEFMATILNEDPIWHTSRRSKYNWDEWLDGRTWSLKKDEDFAVSVTSLRTAAANAARVRGLGLKSKPTADGIILRAVHKEASVPEAAVSE